MQNYSERQDQRRERLLNAAQKAREESQRRLSTADRIADMIPMGQPILVGHHSEKRHRRDLSRIDQSMRKGFELAKQAEDLERRALAVGKGGISSDDPDAIAKLRAQVVDLEAFQVQQKATNKLVRKKDHEGLAAMGYSPQRIAQLFTPDFCGRVGFPDYSISGNSANIRRIKKRIADLEAMAVRPEMAPISGDGWRIREDRDENRILIEFDSKPSREMLDKLRTYGFKWSPTRCAHVRMISNGAEYAAKSIFGIAP